MPLSCLSRWAVGLLGREAVGWAARLLAWTVELPERWAAGLLGRADLYLPTRPLDHWVFVLFLIIPRLLGHWARRVQPGGR
jgi:hypothetical protein